MANLRNREDKTAEIDDSRCCKQNYNRGQHKGQQVFKGTEKCIHKALPLAIHNQRAGTLVGINSKFYQVQQSAGLHKLPVKMRDIPT
jgi:hypothetical protein